MDLTQQALQTNVKLFFFKFVNPFLIKSSLLPITITYIIIPNSMLTIYAVNIET